MAVFIPYTVLSRDEEDQLMPGTTNFVKVVHVTYRGQDGVVGSIDIPQAQYTPAAVDAAIQANLGQHAAVAQLGTAPIASSDQ